MLIIVGFGVRESSAAAYWTLSSDAFSAETEGFADDPLDGNPPCNVLDNSSSTVPGLFGKDRGGGSNAFCGILIFTNPLKGGGWAQAWIEGLNTNSVRIKWYVGSKAYHNGDRFLFDAYGIANLIASFSLGIAGEPPGTPVNVSYGWSALSFNNYRPELAPPEDEPHFVKNTGFEVNGTSLISGAFNLPEIRGFIKDDGTNSFGSVSGATVSIGVQGDTHAEIHNPGRGAYNEDVAQAVFQGEIVLTVNGPQPNPPWPPFEEAVSSGQLNPEFSLDIGSDRELSDPNADGDEGFDPGDAYLWGGPVVPAGGGRDGIRDDREAFPVDPLPAPPLTTTGAPTCSGLPPAAVATSYFDTDGMDAVDFSLLSLVNPNQPLAAPITKFFTNCIYGSEWVVVSQDDDSQNHYVGDAFNCGVPVSTGPDHGTVDDDDEVIAVNLLTGLLPTTTGMRWGIRDEVGLHQSLAPDPDGSFPDDKDDDVDGLDISEGTSVCTRWLISPDHEATYADATIGPLDPGDIYEVDPAGGIDLAIDEVVHLGLPQDTDIDAFELTWTPQNGTGPEVLTLLFSVDNDDYVTPVIESGQLEPGVLYASYLTGTYFEYTDEPIVGGDVDAIASWVGPFTSGTPFGGCPPDFEWDSLSPNGPSQRWGHTMAYDQDNQMTVLFGGLNSNETWVWNGSSWSQRFAANMPQGRTLAKMVYDSQNKVMVLFGGQNGNTLLGDTWLYDVAADSWTLASAGGGSDPQPRSSHTMAFDAARGKVVLYGGTNGGLAKFGDTWEFDVATSQWTLVSNGGVGDPPGRSSAAMAYDRVAEVCVLYSGNSNNGTLADTWEYDGAQWTQVTTSADPNPRGGHDMAFADIFGGVLIYGGNSGDDTGLWLYDRNATTWRQLELGTPGNRSGHAMAFDLARRQLVLFGGAGAGDETWVYPRDVFMRAFCISGTSTGIGWSWKIEGTSYKVEDRNVAALPVGAPAEDFAARFVETIDASNCAGLVAAPMPENPSCFLVTVGDNQTFDFCLGTVGQEATNCVTPTSSVSFNPTVNETEYPAGSCSCPNQGDVAPLAGPGDGIINVLDVIAMIDNVFRSGPPLPQDPNCPVNRGDLNCDDVANVLDVVAIIDNVFRSGPDFCDPCIGQPLSALDNDATGLARQSVPESARTPATLELESTDSDEGWTATAVITAAEHWRAAQLEWDFEKPPTDMDVEALSSSSGLQTYWSLDGDKLTVGLLDPNGEATVSAGATTVLKFSASGEFPGVKLSDGLLVDLNNQPLPVTLETLADIGGSTPYTYSLGHAYPNPFNAGTVIEYGIASDEHVTLEVFDVLGRRVKTLVDGLQAAGVHSVAWDGRDEGGARAASGMYFYRLTAGTFRESRKMVLLK